MLNILFTMTTFELGMKLDGFKSTLFVDKYFYNMQLIQSGFIWFIIICYFLMLLLTKSKWMVNKEYIEDVTAGQEMAITYITKARAFKERLLKSRSYGPEQKEDMANIISNLEKEFNNLAGKQPIIMDAMLETMEHLKQMRHNYEHEPDVFNFDYKGDLDGVVKDRPKVYGHQKLTMNELDSEEEEAASLE